MNTKISKAQYKINIKDVASLLLIIATLTGVIMTSPCGLIDDAYISYRYAYNLAYNGELVFNLGERVEGITNLLWTLILAVQAAIFHFPIERFAVFLSIGLIFFTSFRLWQLGPILGSTRLAGTIATLLIVLNPEFVHTTTNGLEAALYTALLIEIIYRHSRNQLVIAFLAAGLLFMTRPEGVALGFLLLILVYMERHSVRQIITGISILCVIILLVTSFRIFYYGDPVPNSVHAKYIEFGMLPIKQIISYFTSFFIANLHFAVLLAVSLYRFLRIRSFTCKSNSVMLFCICGIAFSYIVVIRNGGDWMPNHRLILQYAALYAVLLILLLRRNIIWIIIVSILVIYPFTQTIYYALMRNVYSFSIINPDCNLRFWEDTIKRLKPLLSDTDIVSAESIGYISYHLLQTKIHDPIGLTDAYIAKHGRPCITFGKKDINYTLGVVLPSVMIWEYAHHLKGADQNLLDNYQTFCAEDCCNWHANVVMIRLDKLDNLAPAFDDWQKIKIETNWIGIK